MTLDYYYYYYYYVITIIYYLCGKRVSVDKMLRSFVVILAPVKVNLLKYVVVIFARSARNICQQSDNKALAPLHYCQSVNKSEIFNVPKMTIAIS